MRLAFPNGEHEEVSIGSGTTSIGSSADDDISLTGDDVKPGHALIIVDQRGITLAGQSDSGPMQVNNRAVLEKAILRLGDQITVGAFLMVLRADTSSEKVPSVNSSDPVEVEVDNPARFLLRGIEGQFQGRVRSLFNRLTLGSDDSADLVVSGVGAQHATIDLDGDTVYLRQAEGGGQTDVNGNDVDNVLLNPGDQITLGDERFMLEAPGFVPGKVYASQETGPETSNTQVFTAPVIEEPGEPASEDDARAQRRRRDNIVVGVCLFISSAMLVWLGWIYFNS